MFLDAPRMGGAERYFTELALGFASAGVDTHVLSPDGPTIPHLDERLREHVTIHVLEPRPPFDGNLIQNAWRARKPRNDLASRLRTIRPDILHINNGGYPGSHLCRAAVFATRAVVLMTVNSRAQPRTGARGLVYPILDRLVWRRLAYAICPSRASGDALIQTRDLPPEKLAVIYYGIDQPAVTPEEVERLRAELSPDGSLLVGMVAPPDKSPDAVFKGHDVFLDAIAYAGRSDLVAALVGQDPGHQFWERAERLGVAKQLKFVGPLANTALHMSAFDLLVVPSTRYEAIPLVILEAMAYGTPVLGSRLSGIPEAVVSAETGFTFEPGDARGLAALLNRCLDDRQLLRQLGEGALRRFTQLFSRRRMVAETLALYAEAVATRR